MYYEMLLLLLQYLIKLIIIIYFLGKFSFINVALLAFLCSQIYFGHTFTKRV